MCDITLTSSDIVATLAALIAGLSTLYARWAWKEANRSNELSLLNHRKDIFDALYDLNMHITQKGQFAVSEEVTKFFIHSRNSSHYFSNSLSEKISEYYGLCFKVADLAKLHSPMYPSENKERSEALEKCLSLYPDIEKEVRKVIGKSVKNG
jgi:hypothetical protein